MGYGSVIGSGEGVSKLTGSACSGFSSIALGDGDGDGDGEGDGEGELAVLG